MKASTQTVRRAMVGTYAHAYTHADQHSGLTGIYSYRQTYPDKLTKVKAKALASDLKAIFIQSHTRMSFCQGQLEKR